LNAGDEAPIKTRNIDVLHGPERGVRHRRLEVEPHGRRSRVLIISHGVDLVRSGSGRLVCWMQTDIGNGRRGSVVMR
jgi:hypothetical protein